MIKVTYLAAGAPLGKTFSPEGVTPYPLTKRFTSMDMEVPPTLKGMAQRVVANRRHALHGNALLKGVTLRKLDHEPRAGLVDPLARNQVFVLDVDNFVVSADGFPALDRRTTRAFALQIKALLPPALRDCSCLCSASSSMGMNPGKLSFHFEFWLDEPQLPQWHRDAIRYLNLSLRPFRDQLELAASGTSFRWKLDPALASNAQIRYIAMPQFLGGIQNPIPDVRARHFLLCGKETLVRSEDLTAPPTLNGMVTRAINEFRMAAGLPAKKESLSYIGPADNRVAVVTNPDRVSMQYVRDNDKFVYYNINNGDSNAYYVRKHEPHVVYNFKGEPPFVFEAADPDTYRWHISQWVLEGSNGKKIDAPPIPIVFRDPTVDTYFAGLIEVGTGRVIEINPIRSLKAMEDFMAQRGAPMPDPIPEFYYRFEPDEPYTFDPVGRRINKYVAPELYVPETEPFPWDRTDEWMRLHCPNIRLLAFHALGGDKLCFNRFMNWLAAIFQTKQKLTTAWVLQGCQGTGKGLLLSKIIAPLLGREYCKSTTIESLEDQFNAQLENALMVVFDEFRLDTSKQADKIYNKLKNLIGENRLDIREMRQNRVQKEVFFSCMFYSNDRDLVRIPRDDRRFNVAPRQEVPLTTVVCVPTLLENMAKEFDMFAAGMAYMQIDTSLLNVVLKNEARATLQALSETTVDEFVRAVGEGDIDYFTEVMDMDYIHAGAPAISAARATLRRWLDSEIRPCNDGTASHRVTNEDLRVMYSALVSPVESSKKFGRMLGIHGIDFKRVRHQDTFQRMVHISWQIDQERFEALKRKYVHNQLPANVAHLNR